MRYKNIPGYSYIVTPPPYVIFQFQRDGKRHYAYSWQRGTICIVIKDYVDEFPERNTPYMEHEIVRGLIG